MENDKMLAIVSQTNHQILEEKKAYNDGIELGTNPLRPPWPRDIFHTKLPSKGLMVVGFCQCQPQFLAHNKMMFNG